MNFQLLNSISILQARAVGCIAGALLLILLVIIGIFQPVSFKVRSIIYIFLCIIGSVFIVSLIKVQGTIR